ncbi:hypothetical protein FA13DRAFT_1737151 [Coprinellus micaceus]|uniref:MYND-type domain-containing protein n=1 Tax=Coprinellus micaceus TaxID=71717 RepID=A0A4Y7SYL7_COPMI|nr:hypothetical protein FA13DRAFT_1737151 [Coprinellus micaceus]
MAEENDEEAKKKGCVVNTLFQIYIRGSTVAKMNALDKLSEDGTSHSAADRLVRVGIARAQAIALCSIGYLVFADPTLLLAFRTYPFIQEIMSALTVITGRLGFEGTHAAYYFPLHLLQWKLEAWTMVDGINPLVAMCQLMQGGLNIDDIAFTMHESYCEALASWIAPYQSFPSAWEKLDKESLFAVEARLGESIVKAWVTLKAAFLLGQSRFLAHPEPRLCDNVYHAAVSGTKPHLKGNVQETCASCHSVMYCSIACQAMDWRRSHREDCQSLRHAYDGLKLTHKWIHGSTRLFLFASIESVYRLNCALVESKKAAHPEHGNSNLIVTYDFAKVPGYPDDVRGAYGRNRLEDVIRQLTTQADMRVIEGQFRVGGRYLWVVVRMRVLKDQAGNERHDLARMVGGFSYLGPKERNGAENAVPQHTGFCQVPNCRCDYGQ